MIALLNPVGYVGGGTDDWHYLTAAQCWARHGACLPHDHWSARWPLIAPLGAALWFGESRAALAAVPLAFAVAAILLLAHVAARLFGRATGLAAGSLLALTPVFALSMARPNVDMVELAFLLAALAAWLAATERPAGRAFAFAAGAALCLAVQTRETSLVYVALFGLWFLLSAPASRRITWWAVPGFLLPMAAEMLVHAATSGDPFLRLRLALGHARIPSSELAAQVDTARSPLLNPDFIAGWKPASGIDVHWLLNPLINLVAHPAIGLALLAPLVLIAAYFSRNILAPPARRRTLLLLGAAALASLILIYVLAIDPKPRMFMPLAAAAAIATAAFGVAAWQAKRRLLAGVIGLAFAANAFLIIGSQPGMRGTEAAAARWIDEADAPLSSDETTRRLLALVPAARALPDAGPSHLLQLRVSLDGCSAIADGSRRIERAFRLGQDDPPFRRALRRLAGDEKAASPSLCLLRSRR
jgi:4-amino-4-deoxy-L-arabinose transferase-like glycosyltransferase